MKKVLWRNLAHQNLISQKSNSSIIFFSKNACNYFMYANLQYVLRT